MLITASHNLAAGVVLTNSLGDILVVRDKHGWSLPKGSTEPSETTQETAIRELREETGIHVNIIRIAFIIEYRSEKFGQYLQIYYAGNSDDEPHTEDPDDDIREVKFIAVTEIRKHLKFRPWVVTLEEWIKDPTFKYHFIDLNVEGFCME